MTEKQNKQGLDPTQKYFSIKNLFVIRSNYRLNVIHAKKS